MRRATDQNVACIFWPETVEVVAPNQALLLEEPVLAVRLPLSSSTGTNVWRTSQVEKRLIPLSAFAHRTEMLFRQKIAIVCLATVRNGNQGS
ncbi:MAG: hypothetical protein ACI9XZ_004281 [Alphaproteobacteria bacterium]|jgi:hypothetical protein